MHFNFIRNDRPSTLSKSTMTAFGAGILRWHPHLPFLFARLLIKSSLPVSGVLRIVQFYFTNTKKLYSVSLYCAKARGHFWGYAADNSCLPLHLQCVLFPDLPCHRVLHLQQCGVSFTTVCCMNLTCQDSSSMLRGDDVTTPFSLHCITACSERCSSATTLSSCLTPSTAGTESQNVVSMTPLHNARTASQTMLALP